MKIHLSILAFLLFLFANGQNFEIYVSDAGNFANPPWQILKFDSNGQNPSVFINHNLIWPQDILFLEDSNLVLISNLGSGNGYIGKHDAVTGAFLGVFAGGISGPTRIKIGPDGLLYVLQWGGTGRVKRYNLDGSFVDDFTNVGVPQSIGIDWDKSNNLYVSSYNGDMVRRFDTTGILIGTFIDSNLVGPTNIWFEGNGDLLVADYNGGAVKRFDSTGTYLGVFISGLNKCEGVDFMPNGNILIGNGGTHSVKMYDNTGVYQNDIISNGAGNLMTPNAVVLRPVLATVIPEIEQSEELLFYPTMGSNFNFNESILESIDDLRIYDSVGNLVFVTEKIENPFWNAQAASDGIYTLTVKFKNGAFQSEVLFVKKQ